MRDVIRKIKGQAGRRFQVFISMGISQDVIQDVIRELWIAFRFFESPGNVFDPIAL